MELPGTPSDDVEGVLATGRGDISTVFVSMATRHPEGLDADYLRWHTLDHRPEQHRLSTVRASLRLVSTPECRAARWRGAERFDAVDHVMTYFFSDPAGLQTFNDLSIALGDAGRKMRLLPPVQRGVYTVDDKSAAPRIKVGADVLPWWPVLGGVLLLERENHGADELLEVDGVAGVWTTSTSVTHGAFADTPQGQHLTYCFLDDDPVVTARRMDAVLRDRWTDGEPLLAAPFYPVTPHQWDRRVP